MVDNRNRRHRVQLELIKEAYPQLVLQNSISLRSAVADALSEKIFLGDLKKSSAKKANEEFSALAEWVLNNIN